MVLVIVALIFLIILAVYSVVSFEVGHWFREGLWVFYEAILIALFFPDSGYARDERKERWKEVLIVEKVGMRSGQPP